MFAIAALATSAGLFSDFTIEKSELKLCSPCIQFSEQGINILLNEILNAGVVGGCGKLCSALPAGVKREACDIVCDVVGIKTFIKALNKTDLDPFYFCEELKACPAGPDDASISLDGNAVSPAGGAVGTTFQLQLQFSVANASGVGEIHIDIDGGSIQQGQSFVNTGFAPGHYATNVSLTVQNSDPGASDPVFWNPGTYKYSFKVCQGECGSKHPHSKFFGTTTGTFQITA